MCRKASLIFALLLLVVSVSGGWAQTPGLDTEDQSQGYYEAAAEATESAPPAPAATNAEATGESVVDLSTFVSAYLADTGRLPDLVQVKTGAGNLRVLSTAEAFILIARAVDMWRTNGERPSAVPIAPANVSRPYIDPEDVVQVPVDVNVGREIATESFLDQAQATVRWVDRTRRIPTAVFVDGQRLSAAEYLAGLAICVEYADAWGGVEDSIFLPSYAPPTGWIGSASPAQAAEGESGEGEGGGAEQNGAEGSASEQSAGQAPVSGVQPMAPPVAEEASSGGPQKPPRLVVFPRPGQTVSGVVELVASYSGPRAKFVLFSVDNATRAIMNIPPFGYRWDASALPPGTHTVRVQVLGEGNVALIDQVSAYTVVAPKQEAPVEEQPEEF